MADVEGAPVGPGWSFELDERRALWAAYTALGRVGQATHDVVRHGAESGGWDPVIDEAHQKLGVVLALIAAGEWPSRDEPSSSVAGVVEVQLIGQPAVVAAVIAQMPMVLPGLVDRNGVPADPRPAAPRDPRSTGHVVQYGAAVLLADGRLETAPPEVRG